MRSNKHEFALYSKLLPQDTKSFAITDAELLQRISKILRLKSGNTFSLFDGIQVLEVVIISSDKKQCIVDVQIVERVSPLKPEINCIVPVLKRDALEDVIYAAVELGATSIQLVFTDKIHRVWAGAKEFDRLRGIMIAACEQAKQFVVPALHAPLEFDEVVQKLDGTIVFFDVGGQPAYDVMMQLRKEKASCITMLMGPEADLTESEKDVLRGKGVIFCKLTPTVLRAKQAFAVGLGMLRSMI